MPNKDETQIIEAPQTGNDYETLDKVNRFIKEAALVAIPELQIGSLETILEPIKNNFTPEQKFWLMKALWFKPVSNYQWRHPAIFGEPINFDLRTDSFMSLISRVFKAGYKYKADEIH